MHLQKVYERYTGPIGWGDKGTAHSYIDIYEEQMTRKSHVDILEIGVYKGHSIKMWQDYFTDSNVYGVDINLSHLEFDDCDNVFLCNATSEKEISNIFGEQQFDYIVDDGSHIIQEQTGAFDVLWPRIKPGGKYFIEDIDGDKAIKQISNHLNERDIEFTLFDNRNVKNLWNDMIFMMEKRG